MTALSSHIQAMRALGSAFHSAAENRMERAGKVAPLTKNEPDRIAALVLGSIAQAYDEAADRLNEEDKELARRALMG